MKVNEMTMNQGSRGDKSVVWTVSDTYVNWCQIVVGNPEYLEKLYSGPKKGSCPGFINLDNLPPSILGVKSETQGTSVRRPTCGCSSNQATGPTDLVAVKGPCGMEEYNQWKKLIELVEMKQKCAELQRRLQNETFYKGRMAMTKDCKKQVFECPCVPRNTDAYVKDLGKLGNKDGDKNGNKNKKKGKGAGGKGGKGGGGGGKGKNQGASKGQKGGKKNKGFSNLDYEPDSCIEFKLSTDEKKGASENVTKKIFTFRTDPFCFEGNYFKKRDCGEKYFYPNGRIAGLFECDGTGTIFYPNGEVAITVSKGKLGCRLQIMSKSGHDAQGQYFKSAPIGLFDSKGNGVIYDNYGKIRLNYDQAEGILYDTLSGAPARWQWQLYSLVKTRREQLQGVKEDDTDDEEEVEVKPVVVQAEVKGKKGSKGKAKISGANAQPKKHQASPVGRSTISASQSHPKNSLSSFSKTNNKKENDIEDWAAFIEQANEKAAIEPRPIALKINQYLSLRILKQEHIHLDFRPYPLHFHLNLGVKVKPESIERIDRVSVDQKAMSAVPCYFELLHTRTRSLRNLHSNLETIRKDNVTEDRINFIKKAKLMGILKYITQMAMKKLNQDEQRLTKMIYKCQ